MLQGGARHRSWSRHAGRYQSLRHWASSGLQCVPFARENSGIELSGNAVTWWEKAEGLYQRGAKPEVGGILNFRATRHMPMGHVAVVTNVLNSRHIEIDHANWSAPGQISRDIDVIDVSEANDWTAVRVELGDGNTYGSVYPTYGFIYDRPDSGTMLANSDATAAPTLNAAPSDLRPVSDRIETAVVATAPEEVAEATDDDVPASHTTRHWRHLRTARRAVHGRTQLALNGFAPRQHHAATRATASHVGYRLPRHTHH